MKYQTFKKTIFGSCLCLVIFGLVHKWAFVFISSCFNHPFEFWSPTLSLTYLFGFTPDCIDQMPEEACTEVKQAFGCGIIVALFVFFAVPVLTVLSLIRLHAWAEK